MLKGKKVILGVTASIAAYKSTFIVRELKKAGAKVNDTYVVFHYGIFQESLTNMAKLGVKLHALATWWDVLDVARENNLYTSSQLDIVENYLDDPESWSHNN